MHKNKKKNNKCIKNFFKPNLPQVEYFLEGRRSLVQTSYNLKHCCCQLVYIFNIGQLLFKGTR